MVRSDLPIAVVQMGLPPVGVRSRVGDQVDWFCATLGRGRDELLVVRPAAGDPLPPLERFSMAIVSGSWSMVTDHLDWSERTGAWIRDLIVAGKPVLGVCYGHQLMAQAMGGTVGDLPGGREQGAFEVRLNAAGAADTLFVGGGDHFPAYLSHTQSVLVPPDAATVLGGTARDPYQILQYSPTAVSVQFHPEFTARVLQACVADRMERDGRPLGDQSGSGEKYVAQTCEARDVLLRFVSLHRHAGPKCAADIGGQQVAAAENRQGFATARD